MDGLLQHLRSTSEGYKFERTELAPGVTLHVQPSDRFKEVTFKLYELNPLDEWTSERALIPMVLRCGCQAYPTRQDVAVRLQSLYGSTVNVSAVKFGHVHMQKYELSCLSSRYLDGTNNLPESAVSLLCDIVTDPVTEQQENNGGSGGGHFDPEYVEQQRKQLLDLIDARKEDQRSYAVHRCIKHLYMDDPYRRSRYGDRDRVQELTSQPLYDRYRTDLSSSRVDLVAVGDFDTDSLQGTLSEGFVDRIPDREPVELETVSTPSPGGGVRQITEPGEGDQSWLIMGYQTPIVMGHPEMYVLSMMAGLFGGFPHSKLHRQVREEKGLAYDVQASLKRSVGLLLVTAGIESSNREKTVDAIKACRDDLVSGNFSEQELEMTRRKLIDQLVDLEDSPSQKADSYHNRVLAGNVEKLQDIAEKVMQVDPEQIQESAEELSLEIEYCLE
jgi:predicted Zn-dependent peptidase